ncbi:hypothetical protein HDU83_002931 [Entophlyctis luteolus]|nr:hypothetical protein HDU83_002931 [Entophlyctis luteolus]
MKGEMEKAKIMKLLLATAVATKYALQGKDPYKFKDLNQLLPADFISRGSSLNSRLRRHSSADIFSSRSRQSSLIPSLSNTSPQANVDDDALPALPKSTINKHTFPAQFASARSRDDVHAATADGNTLQRRCLGNVINVPLDILHHIANYARVQRKSGALAAEDAAATVSAIASVIDCVTKYEQILYFPVPQSYDIHIKQVLILYFALLPLQLVKPMGWAMVLATFVMSVTFFGIDAIAGEISDPFGNDENDLPLDYFCQKLREDLEYIMDSRFDVSVLSSDEDFKESPGTTTNEEDVGTETKRQLRKRK